MGDADSRYQFSTGEVAVADPDSGGVYLVDAGEDPRTLDEVRHLAASGAAVLVDGPTLDSVSANLSSVRVLESN